MTATDINQESKSFNNDNNRNKTVGDRVPPQNIEAEQAVLGAMLLSRQAISTADDILVSDDFYRESHRQIFLAMRDLFYDNEQVDLITLSDRLQKKGLLESIGISYMSALDHMVPTAANIEYHAKIVREKSLLRRLIDAATDIAASAYEEASDADFIVDDAERRILGVALKRGAADFSTMKESLMIAFGNIEKLYDSPDLITGLSTGFRDLDELTSGLQKSDLILVAARPSMGKTAFTLNIATNAAAKGKAVAFFSLEMSKEQLVQRMLCAESKIDSQVLRNGKLSDDEWNELITSVDKLSRYPVYIDDTPGITVGEMRAKARRLKNKGNLDLIIIDYLQLMQGRGNKSGDNRQNEISEISRSLKSLARELQVPVIALSQLSRSVEARQVKRPMLSDLRESGSLEQDADIVMFLYREDYYNQDTEEKNITEVIIAKHRNGPIGSVKLYFQKDYTLFRDLAYNNS